MKKLTLFLASLLLLTATWAQTADEIISKHIEAIGGADKLKKLRTIQMEGSMNVMGSDVTIKIFQEHQKGNRQNIVFNGMEGYNFNTPTEGWSFMPMMGQTEPQALPEAAVKAAADDLDLSGYLVDYAAKGHKIEYLGKKDVGGTACHAFKVMRKSGSESTIYIDPSTYYLIRTTSMQEMMGQQTEVSIDLSDYRDVDGYKMPFSLTQQYGTLVISSIKINEKLPDGTFSK